jgi:hypothetical protein
MLTVPSTPLTVTQNTYCVQLCKQSNMSAMMRGSMEIYALNVKALDGK